MMRFKGNGLGLYPDELNPQGVACYDPNRPSWLPDWIDTPTESACYYNSPTLAGQAGAVVGQAVNQAVGGVLGGATGTNPLDVSQYLPWIVGGVAALGLLIVLPSLMGHR
jgi:hypothetical protein